MMGLRDLKTDLKSLRYSGDTLGGGTSNQPYIKAKIPDGFNNLQNANIEYIIAQTSNEKVKKGLIYANTRLLDAQEELQRTSVDYTKQKTDEIR